MYSYLYKKKYGIFRPGLIYEIETSGRLDFNLKKKILIFDSRFFSEIIDKKVLNCVHFNWMGLLKCKIFLFRKYINYFPFYSLGN